MLGNQKTNLADTVSVSMIANGADQGRAGLGGVFTVTCVDANGNKKWSEDFHNLVVNVGLKNLNESFFSGVGYTAEWYIGLVTVGGTYSANDTMLSHAGWTENVDYLQSARPTLVFGTATTADPSVISTTAAVFTANATGTIAGAFVSSSPTKGGTTGVLFSVGNFTVGSKPVTNGDTLNVSYSFSADAA